MTFRRSTVITVKERTWTCTTKISNTKSMFPSYLQLAGMCAYDLPLPVSPITNILAIFSTATEMLVVEFTFIDVLFFDDEGNVNIIPFLWEVSSLSGAS